MIIVIRKQTKPEEIQKLTDFLGHFNIKSNLIYGEEATVLGLVGDTSSVPKDSVEMYPFVEKVMKVQEPYKRANRKFHPDDTVIDVGGVTIGGREIVVMAGPCSVESEPQIIELAGQVKQSGAQFLRGGAFKPRTSPYSFQGLKAEGIQYMRAAREVTGLPVVSEIMDAATIGIFDEHVDIIQVGARNMQNFELLKELGRLRKPILLKRGFSNTFEEMLMSAEYIMSGGNEQVILCERGIRTFESYTRNTLDISAIPALKKLSHLPVIVDPSHATGMSWMVPSLAVAAVAAGADGLMIEVHGDPKTALSDGAQSLTPDQFDDLMNAMEPVAQAVGRTLKLGAKQ